MLNDLTTPATLLATRRSGRPRDMVAPGPDADQLRAIVGAAARVPDHGKLAPWRFVEVPQDARDAFAALLLRAFAVERPDAGEAERASVVQFAQQAPTLVVVLSCPKGAKIPHWEQHLSAGAACQQLLNAATAHGFVGGWLTTWAAYSDIVRDAFGGGPDDRIAGFLFLGTPSRPLDERPRPESGTVYTTWAV